MRTTEERRNGDPQQAHTEESNPITTEAQQQPVAAKLGRTQRRQATQARNPSTVGHRSNGGPYNNPSTLNRVARSDTNNEQARRNGHNNEQGRNHSDRDLRDGEERRRLAQISQLNTRVSPLVLFWVLISTNLCAYTHHTHHSSELASTLYPPSYPSPRAIPTIYPLHCRHLHTTTTRCSLNSCPPLTTPLAPTLLHHGPPPKTPLAPTSSMPKSSPTHHNTTHTHT